MGHELLVIGGLLAIAGLLGRLARRYGLPTVPVYMLVGLLGSPAVSFFPLSIPYEQIELLAVLGLVLLLFDLGLEFDLDDFFDNARSLVLAGSAYIVLNVGAGLGLGFALGWGTREALVIAGITGISSSAIVTKLLVELQRLTNDETPMILGVIVVEDIFLAIYLAVLSGVLGDESSVGATMLRLGGSFLFLVVMFVIARRAGRWVGRLIHTPDTELFTIAVVGLAILMAGTAEEVGVSDAIGAFLMGLIIAGTKYRDRVEQLVLPLRDVFAAVFFLAFGLSLVPSTFGSVVVPVAIAVVVTVVANVSAGLISARSRGLGLTAGLNAGLTLVSRGEFALILATIAIGAGLDARISPFAGLYVLVLAVIGPILAANSPSIAEWLRPRLRAGRSRITRRRQVEIPPEPADA